MKNIFIVLTIIVSMVIACTPKASPAVTEATIPTSKSVSKETKTIEALAAYVYANSKK